MKVDGEPLVPPPIFATCTNVVCDLELWIHDLET